MTALLRLFFDILCMRRGPQDVPAAAALAALCTGAYALLGLLSVALNSPLRQALAQTVLDLVLLAGFTHVLLNAHRRGARFLQTFTALTGTGALFALIAAPVLFAFPDDPAQATPALVVFLYFTLVIWSIAVMGHIYAQALSASRARGLAWSIAYFVLSFVAVAILLSQFD